MEHDLSGQHIGPYEIVERIGQTGIIEVYQGYHPELQRPVIMRVAGRQMAEDSVFSARFRREAKAIARLRHPNITQMYDYGAIGGGHYTISEQAEGATLTGLLNEIRGGGRGPGPEDITFYIRQIAAALDHAHSTGVTHGEVTPYNIILGRSSQAWLDGFGLALLRMRDGGVSAPPPWDYLAPEQIHDPNAVTPLSDVYSLGAVLYELLTGELPFQAESDIDEVLRSLHESAPDPRYLAPDLAPSVAAVVQKALARSPRGRFTNSMQLAAALEWAYAHPAIGSLPETAYQAEADGKESRPSHPTTEQVVIKRRPSRREEQRQKRRLRVEHRQAQKEERARERRLEQNQQIATRIDRQAQRLNRRRSFVAAWGRGIVLVLVIFALIAAAGYLLQTTGILSIAVDLPVKTEESAEILTTPTITPTATDTPTPTLTPTPTPLTSAGGTPLPPLVVTPLEVGTSAYRIHDGGVMQFIPAGRFLMGTDDPLRKSADRPQHDVVLGDYWIDQTEVTNSQYKLCVEAGSCQPQRDLTYADNPEYADYPATYVSYEAAAAYCLWLAGRSGQIVGLPTEAQWEKAAAWDPVEEHAQLYPWGDSRPTAERLQYSQSGAVRPAAPVGMHPAGVSAYGVFDMAGNVWEWVADWYDPNYYNRTGISRDPTGPLSGTIRITRGGSWTRDGSLALSSFRNPVRPTTASNEIGFRCAMTAGRPSYTSGILLTPLDTSNALSELLEAVSQEQIVESPAASADTVPDELDQWITALDEITLALQSGNNSQALTLVTLRLGALEDLQEEILFTPSLKFKLEEGLSWIQEQLAPPPPPTATPTISATPTDDN